MKSPKNFLIVSLFVMLLCSTTVFVAIISPRDLSASVKDYNNESWNVKIESVDVVNTTGNAIYDKPSFTATSIKYNNSFSVNGDSVTYKVKVKNNGSYDAKIDYNSLFMNNNDSLYVNVISTEPSNILKKGEETEFTVSFQYVNNVNIGVFNNTCTGFISYIQK